MKNRFRFEKAITFIVLFSGVILAVTQFIINRSLWIDEAMLALNILEKDPLNLLKPLSHNQVAPILFLQIEKFFSLLIPNSEFGLRILPFISYLVSLFAFYKISKILFKNSYVQIFVLSVFVFNSTLIYYSSEVKQYMSDVAVVCLIYYFLLKEFKLESNRYKAISIVGIVSILLSNIAVVILITSGIYLLINNFKKENRKNFLFCFSAIGITFILYYLFFIFGHPTRNIMITYWSQIDAFLPASPLKIEFYIFLQKKFQSIIGILSNYNDGYILYSLFITILFVLGVIILILRKSNHKYFVLLVLPVIIHLTLSYFKLYPFDKRLILYLIPLLILLVGYGFSVVLEWTLTNLKILRYRPLAFIIVAFLILKFYNNEFPIKREEIKESLNYIDKENKLVKYIYLYYGATNSYMFYDKINKTTKNYNVVFGSKSRMNKKKYIDEILCLSGEHWLLFSHVRENEEEYIINQLDSIGINQLDFFKTTGSSTYLYDFGP